MKIFSSRNDNLLSRYVCLDILNRKLQKEIPFRPENLYWTECVTLSLPRAKAVFLNNGQQPEARLKLKGSWKRYWKVMECKKFKNVRIL